MAPSQRRALAAAQRYLPDRSRRPRPRELPRPRPRFAAGIYRQEADNRSHAVAGRFARRCTPRVQTALRQIEPRTIAEFASSARGRLPQGKMLDGRCNAALVVAGGLVPTKSLQFRYAI